MSFSSLNCIATFVNCGPLDPSPIILANNGYRFSSEDNCIVCGSCSVKFAGWINLEDLRNQHRIAAPNCYNLIRSDPNYPEPNCSDRTYPNHLIYPDQNNSKRTYPDLNNSKGSYPNPIYPDPIKSERTYPDPNKSNRRTYPYPINPDPNCSDRTYPVPNYSNPCNSDRTHPNPDYPDPNNFKRSYPDPAYPDPNSNLPNPSLKNKNIESSSLQRISNIDNLNSIDSLNFSLNEAGCNSYESDCDPLLTNIIIMEKNSADFFLSSPPEVSSEHQRPSFSSHSIANNKIITNNWNEGRDNFNSDSSIRSNNRFEWNESLARENNAVNNKEIVMMISNKKDDKNAEKSIARSSSGSTTEKVENKNYLDTRRFDSTDEAGNALESRKTVELNINRGNNEIAKTKQKIYVDIESRYKSFLQIDFDSLFANLTKDSLVKAGFYYKGPKDKVCCFYCKLELLDWKKEDDVIIEHLKWRADCQYVNKCLTSEKLQTENDLALEKYKKDKKITGTSFKKPFVPISKLTKIEDFNDEKLLLDKEYKDLLGERIQLNEMITCKICLDNKSNTVFLPCGHFMACSECACKMNNCGLCRDVIKGTVLAFLLLN